MHQVGTKKTIIIFGCRLTKRKNSIVSRIEILKLRLSWPPVVYTTVGRVPGQGVDFLWPKDTQKKSVLCHSQSETVVTGIADRHALTYIISMALLLAFIVWN